MVLSVHADGRGAGQLDQDQASRTCEAFSSKLRLRNYLKHLHIIEDDVKTPIARFDGILSV